MIPFEEDITNPECDGVYYQTPEELKVKHNPEPDVVHDDSLPVKAEKQPKEIDIPEVEEKPIEIPANTPVEVPHHDNHPKYHEWQNYMPSHDNYEMSPIEAIRKVKSNPASVSITRLNGKYYIDHHDLRCYMDACGESNYECALKNIIAANGDDNDLSNDNIGIVIGEDDLLKLDPEIKSAMESSEVNFEVYGN